MRKTALFQVTLMIFLGPEKFWRGLNLGHNLALESSAFCQRILGFFRHGLLLRRMIKNDGAILCANIGPLPVQGCGIMICPENVEQFAKSFFHSPKTAGAKGRLLRFHKETMKRMRVSRKTQLTICDSDCSAIVGQALPLALGT